MSPRTVGPMLAAAFGLLFLTSILGAQTAPIRKQIPVPADLGESTLEPRAKAQLATLDQLEVFAFFRFEDRLDASGIRFVNQCVDDAGRDYKAVHYDHGNGLAVADVDSDGRTDLYFINQVGGNQLWRNLGGGKFEDITERAGVGLKDKIGVTASFGDIDNDGDADLFVTTVKMGNHLFENDGSGRFKDISQTAGVGYVGHSSGAIFFDYDRDGRLDLFVTNVGIYTTSQRGRAGYYVGVDHAFSGHTHDERDEPSILYRNLGAGQDGSVRFEDVSAKTGLIDLGWSGDATPMDFNEDGYPDLYVLNMQGDDHYWENLGGQRFIDKTAAHFSKSPWGTMGVKAFDFDNDGRQDLILSDMHSDMSEEVGVEREKLKSRMQWDEQVLQGGDNNIFGNALFHNLGEGKFAEVSDAMGTENYWPWGLSVGDLNADGFEDVFITSSMNYPFRYGVNTLLLNNRGKKFLDAEFILGVEPRKGKAIKKPWFDLDCGGADNAHKHCQGESGPVTVLGTLGSRASAIFDLDADGDLDIVTNELNSEPQVLVSDLASQKELRTLEIKLVGKKSNRDGLGAMVKVVAGDLVQSKANDGQTGYLSHGLLPLYFGLGEKTKVDRIEVRWPSGTVQTVTDGIALGRRLEIVEPAP